MCCKIIKSILALVIAILALWPTILGAVASKWVIVIAAIAILIHDWCCKKCCGECEVEAPKGRKK